MLARITPTGSPCERARAVHPPVGRARSSLPPDQQITTAVAVFQEAGEPVERRRHGGRPRYPLMSEKSG